MFMGVAKSDQLIYYSIVTIRFIWNAIGCRIGGIAFECVIVSRLWALSNKKLGKLFYLWVITVELYWYDWEYTEKETLSIAVVRHNNVNSSYMVI